MSIEEQCDICPHHEDIKDDIKRIECRAEKAMPRWAVLSAFGFIAALAAGFASWHASAIGNVDQRLHSVEEKVLKTVLKIDARQQLIIDQLDRIESWRERQYGQTDIRDPEF